MVAEADKALILSGSVSATALNAYVYQILQLYWKFEQLPWIKILCFWCL